jgi:hypothetical protein
MLKSSIYNKFLIARLVVVIIIISVLPGGG